MSVEGRSEARSRGPLERALGLVTRVEPGEAPRALLLALDFFVLFAAYYLLKPVRESLILSVDNGPEIKSYTGAVQAALFVAAVPFYGAIADRIRGGRLVAGVYLFFASHLGVFILIGPGGPALGVAFFLWVGLFNLFVVSQTWSLAADLNTPR